MKSKALFGAALAVIASLVTAVAFATPPSGLTSQLLARGAAGEFDVRDKTMKLKIQAKEATDVAVVKATLAPGGQTGWHAHPGPSIVVVKSGTLTMVEAARGSCHGSTFGAGRAFVHPEEAHNFVNTGAGDAEFYVTYFVPAGAAPLLNDVTPVPPECS